jgi:hypothetical protein
VFRPHFQRIYIAFLLGNNEFLVSPVRLREESQGEQSGGETTRNGKRLEGSNQCWVNTGEDTRALVDIWPLLFQVLLDVNKAGIQMVKRTDRAIPEKNWHPQLSSPEWVAKSGLEF